MAGTGNALPGPNTPHQPQHRQQLQSHDPLTPQIKPPPSKGCIWRMPGFPRGEPKHPSNIPSVSLNYPLSILPARSEQPMRGWQHSCLPSPTPHCTSPGMDAPARSEEGLQSPEGREEAKAGEKGWRRSRDLSPCPAQGEFPLPEAAPPGRIRTGLECDLRMRMENEHKPSSPSFHLRSSTRAGESREFRQTAGGVNSSAGSHSKPAPRSTAETFGTRFPHAGGKRMPGHQSHCPSRPRAWVACPHLSPPHAMPWGTPIPSAGRVAAGQGSEWHQDLLLSPCGRELAGCDPTMKFTATQHPDGVTRSLS